MRSLLVLLPLLAGCDIMFQLREVERGDARGPVVRPAVVGSSVTSCSTCATVLLPSPVVTTRAPSLLLVNVVSTSSGGTPAVTTVTYGTTPLAYKARALSESAGTGAVVETWILVDPPTADTSGITVKLGGTASELLVGAMLIEGVSATNPVRAWAAAGSPLMGLMADNTVQSGELDLVVDAVCAGTSVDVPGAAQTVVYLKNSTASYPCANLGTSWSPGSATSATVRWSVNGSTNDHWIDLVTSIAPAD